MRIIYPRAEAVWAFFVAVFTGVLVYLGWCQLRPYIELTPMVVPYFDVTKTQARIIITNTGITPAYDLQAHYWCAHASPKVTDQMLSEAEQLVVSSQGVVRGTIFHDTASFGMNCEPAQALASKDMLALDKDELRTIVWGTITYKASYLTRYCNFCFYLSGPYWKNQVWSQCTFHNDAD